MYLKQYIFRQIFEGAVGEFKGALGKIFEGELLLIFFIMLFLQMFFFPSLISLQDFINIVRLLLAAVSIKGLKELLIALINVLI